MLVGAIASFVLAAMMALLVGLGFAHARRTEPQARLFGAKVGATATPRPVGSSPGLTPRCPPRPTRPGRASPRNETCARPGALATLPTTTGSSPPTASPSCATPRVVRRTCPGSHIGVRPSGDPQLPADSGRLPRKRDPNRSEKREKRRMTKIPARSCEALSGTRTPDPFLTMDNRSGPRSSVNCAVGARASERRAHSTRRRRRGDDLCQGGPGQSGSVRTPGRVGEMGAQFPDV